MLTETAVQEVKSLLLSGLSQRAVAKRTGVSRGTIGAIANGTRKLKGWPPNTWRLPPYLPTLEEIAAKTAEFRSRKLQRKRLANVDQPKRPMTRVDICNVEPADVDQLLDAIRLLTTAAKHEQESLERQARWTVAGREVQ